MAGAPRQRLRGAGPELRSIYFIDGYPFARFDVPGVHLFTDFHADYHQVTDTADKSRLDFF